MVHEEIEDLRKFGEEIKHSSKNVLSKYSQSHSRNLAYTRITSIFYRLYSWVCHLPQWFYRHVKKAMNGITKNLGKLRSFPSGKGNASFRTSEKNSTEKLAFRLVETKKQIGNITVIVRKRIEVPFKLKNPSRLSSYFFHKRSMGLQAIKNHYQRYDSLFDIPVPLHTQKLSLGEKMKLFFLRL